MAVKFKDIYEAYVFCVYNGFQETWLTKDILLLLQANDFIEVFGLSINENNFFYQALEQLKPSHANNVLWNDSIPHSIDWTGSYCFWLPWIESKADVKNFYKKIY